MFHLVLYTCFVFASYFLNFKRHYIIKSDDWNNRVIYDQGEALVRNNEFLIPLCHNRRALSCEENTVNTRI